MHPCQKCHVEANIGHDRSVNIQIYQIGIVVRIEISTDRRREHVLTGVSSGRAGRLVDASQDVAMNFADLFA